MAVGTYEITHEKILESGKQQFLKNGYERTNLRELCKGAGITTGAYYRHFEDKAALFSALVEPAVNGLRERYDAAEDRCFDYISAHNMTDLWSVSVGTMVEFIDFIFDHFDEFKLLLTSGESNTYQEFLHRVVEIDNQCTMRYIQASGNDAISSGRLTPELSHLLSSAFYTGMFEVVIHDMPKEQAVEHIQRMRRFYIAGWKSIFFGDGGENH